MVHQGLEVDSLVEAIESIENRVQVMMRVMRMQRLTNSGGKMVEAAMFRSIHHCCLLSMSAG